MPMTGDARSLQFPARNVLSDQEFLRLLAQARSGDTAARDRIVESNLRLVASLARRFRTAGEDYDELFQVGCIGLLKAIERFDPSFSVRFSTYAVPLILGEIRKHIRDYQLIHVSRSTKSLAAAAEHARAELIASTGQEPPISEIAQVLGKPVEEIAEAIVASSPPVSLFDEIEEDGDKPIRRIDQIGRDSAGAEDDFESLALREAMDRLPERERYLLRLRYFQDLSQQQVAKLLGLSQAQVCRLERKALKNIRQELA